MIPINAVCPANLEKMKETIKSVLEKKMADLGEPAEYYIMPRSRFHASIDRDDILKVVRELWNFEKTFESVKIPMEYIKIKISSDIEL